MKISVLSNLVTFLNQIINRTSPFSVRSTASYIALWLDFRERKWSHVSRARVRTASDTFGTSSWGHEPRTVITRVGKSSASVITSWIPRRTRSQFVGRHEQEKRTGLDYLGCRMHDANNSGGHWTNDVRLFVHSSSFVDRLSLLALIRGPPSKILSPYFEQTPKPRQGNNRFNDLQLMTRLQSFATFRAFYLKGELLFTWIGLFLNVDLMYLMINIRV